MLQLPHIYLIIRIHPPSLALSNWEAQPKETCKCRPQDCSWWIIIGLSVQQPFWSQISQFTMYPTSSTREWEAQCHSPCILKWGKYVLVFFHLEGPDQRAVQPCLWRGTSWFHFHREWFDHIMGKWRHSQQNNQRAGASRFYCRSRGPSLEQVFPEGFILLSSCLVLGWNMISTFDRRPVLKVKKVRKSQLKRRGLHFTVFMK